MFTLGKSNKIKQISVSGTIYIAEKYFSCTNRKVSTAKELEYYDVYNHKMFFFVVVCFFKNPGPSELCSHPSNWLWAILL